MEEKIEIGLIIGWFTMFTVVMGVVLLALNYKAKFHKVEKEKQIATFRASLDAEERQKQRIARDLHDEIMPLLRALGQNNIQHLKDLSNNSLFPGNIEADREIIDQTARGIRAIALDLIPAIFMNFGLFKALEHHVQQANDKNKTVELEVKLENSGEPVFNKSEEANIYRICLEVLSNLQAHAPYSYLRITVDKIESNFVIKFVHDGKGVSNEEIEILGINSGGIGLNSIKSRLLILNGSMYYQKGKVSSITLTIPVTHAI